MTTQPNFEGHEPRECSEHRTLGPHRAWCYGCSEYCYPDGPLTETARDGACSGCRIPALESLVETLTRQRDEAVARGHRLANAAAVAGLWNEELQHVIDEMKEEERLPGGD